MLRNELCMQFQLPIKGCEWLNHHAKRNDNTDSNHPHFQTVANVCQYKHEWLLCVLLAGVRNRVIDSIVKKDCPHHVTKMKKHADIIVNI